MIRAGIIGATGYAGAELVRILSGHPDAEISAVGSVSYEGKPLSGAYPAYYRLCDKICENEKDVIKKSDIVFAALPSGLSQKIAQECFCAGKFFIDMGADFRFKRENDYRRWYHGKFIFPELHEKAAYGLPELFRENIKGSRLVANPGCYATAVSLALAPALESGLISPDGIIADCSSGVTGSGRKITQNTHFPELNESMTAYKAGCHRHTPEMEQTLSTVSGKETHITFVPHLIPVSRGILATCYAKLKPGVTMEQLRNAYEKRYGREFFIRLLPDGCTADIKNVRLSNFCDISLHIDSHTKTLIAVSAIDNMVKGAAGQAMQNMNLMLGLDEKAGLTSLPPAF
jgi:N-acetyl-gamma-glutamyl-phosphate reductase